MKESLRLNPPIPASSRLMTEECVIDGYTVPKGVNANISLYGVNHHHEFWTEPNRFDPERFTKEASSGREPFCFLPFSAGSRNCIGQRFAMIEIKVLLCHLMRHFRIVSDEVDVEKTRGLTLKPLNPLMFSFTRR